MTEEEKRAFELSLELMAQCQAIPFQNADTLQDIRFHIRSIQNAITAHGPMHDVYNSIEVDDHSAQWVFKREVGREGNPDMKELINDPRGGTDNAK